MASNEIRDLPMQYTIQGLSALGDTITGVFLPDEKEQAMYSNCRFAPTAGLCMMDAATCRSDESRRKGL